MLMAERHQMILAKLEQEGKVVAAELCKQFDVSEDTIRRDMRILAQQGSIQRVHGGALPSSQNPVNFASRQQRGVSPAKRRLAQMAVSLLQENQVIFLDAGTTTLQIAKELPPDLHATVITHSPPIVTALCNHPSLRIELLGGYIEKNANVATGPRMIEMLHKIHIDICMLGISCLHPQEGITIYTMEEMLAKQAMVEASAEVVGLATAEKMGTVTTYKVGNVDCLTHLITEKQVSDTILAPFRQKGVTVLTV